MTETEIKIIAIALGITGAIAFYERMPIPASILILIGMFIYLFRDKVFSTLK